MEEHKQTVTISLEQFNHMCAELDELREYKKNSINMIEKIRAEIEYLTITEGGEDYIRKMAELCSLKFKVLQIIDKYKAESEGTE